MATYRRFFILSWGCLLNRLFTLLTSVALSGAALLSGCASMQPVHLTTDVDSFATPEAASKKHYLLLPGNKDTAATDLEFQEYASYINKTLGNLGFVKTSAEEADVLIFLTYAIGNPQTKQYSYNVPQFGQTGVSSSQTYGRVSPYGTYSGTTTYTPTYGVTGYSTQVGSVTTYTRYMLLDAYDVAAFRKDKSMLQLWKTSAISTGSSNDLRYVFPYMVVSASPYIAKNTGRKIPVDLDGADPAVAALRGPTPAAPQAAPKEP